MGKSFTADMRALDVRSLQRAGRLRSEQSFDWQWMRRGEIVYSVKIDTYAGRVDLRYQNRGRNGEWEEMHSLVYLTWTPCNYGGERAWWSCPNEGCGRRVAVLYGGRMFACRHCQHLAYSSQNKNANDRAFGRANALRRKLGWVPGIAFGPGCKPKGMHWKTYARLSIRHAAAAEQAFAGLEASAGTALSRLERVFRSAV